MTNLLVLEAGLLTTVQDEGRHGHAHLGVSAAGAADAVSLRLGNLLVGNEPGAGALEMTLLGGAYSFDAPAIVAITGSEFDPRLDGRRVPTWTSLRVEPGETLRLGPTRDGARCYLCVRGGIGVPRVLGSVSTHLLTGIGGHEGRPLRAGDRLPIGFEPARSLGRLALPVERIRSILSRKTFRVTPGPQEDWFTPDAREVFCSETWQVTEEADRMGLRLHGPALAVGKAAHMVTEGVCLGAVQVPTGGRPIVLFVDQQTTGGYPKIANVVGADLPALGELRPRDLVRFERIGFEQARRLFREQEELLAGAIEALP